MRIIIIMFGWFGKPRLRIFVTELDPWEGFTLLQRGVVSGDFAAKGAGRPVGGPSGAYPGAAGGREYLHRRGGASGGGAYAWMDGAAPR